MDTFDNLEYRTGVMANASDPSPLSNVLYG